MKNKDKMVKIISPIHIQVYQVSLYMWYYCAVRCTHCVIDIIIIVTVRWPYMYMCMYCVHVHVHVYTDLYTLEMHTNSTRADLQPFSPSVLCLYSFFLAFDRVNRTLCQPDAADTDSVLAYVDVFTSSVESVAFSIILELAANYTLR